MKENSGLASKLNKLAYAVSAVVLILVIMMRRIKLDTDIDFSFLPPFHATVNGMVAILLVAALWFIKNGKIEMHKRTIIAALILSVVFLASYVLYHITTEETRFCQEGTIRYVYFFFLISHILLAAVTLPFILFTFIRGFTLQVEKHKRMAKWVWPLWFYVAVTGPVCYWMLAPCY